MERVTKDDLEQAIRVVNIDMDTHTLTLDWAYGGVKVQLQDKDGYIIKDIGPRGTKHEIYTLLTFASSVLRYSK